TAATDYCACLASSLPKCSTSDHQDELDTCTRTFQLGVCATEARAFFDCGLAHGTCVGDGSACVGEEQALNTCIRNAHVDCSKRTEVADYCGCYATVIANDCMATEPANQLAGAILGWSSETYNECAESLPSQGGACDSAYRAFYDCTASRPSDCTQ